MKKAILSNEYDIEQTNKMIVRIPYKDSKMVEKPGHNHTTHAPQMNVILQFPEVSDNTSCIVDEAKLILLDIFQKNMQEQFTAFAVNDIHTKEVAHESNLRR